MDEVRLIVIAALERNARPIDIFPSVNRLQHVLETADAAKDFRCQTDLAVKHFNKPPGAQADSFRYRGHSVGARWMLKMFQGVGDGGVQLERPDELLEKAAL